MYTLPLEFSAVVTEFRLDARRRQEMLQADEDQEGQEEQDSEPNQEHQCTEVEWSAIWWVCVPLSF